MLQFQWQNDTLSKEEAGNQVADLLNNRFSVALWRLPGQKTCGFNFGPLQYLPVDEIKEQGFLLAPFSFNGKGYFIPQVDHPKKAGRNRQGIPWYSRDIKKEEAGKKEFKKKVRYALEQLKGGAFDKVVLARKKCVSLVHELPLLDLFEYWCDRMPGSFVSLVSTPDFGTWLGVTPELLLHFDKNTVNTVALAGTRSKDEDEFSRKEKDEQSLVEKFIRECLGEHDLDFNTSGPEVIHYGNLKHLQTGFSFLSNGVTPGWRSLVKMLHPTPAVCGYPVLTTQIFIRNEEGMDRQLYSGFLGPVSGPDSGSLYVNLRCMEVNNQEAGLYAGAGIVRKSRAPEEWLEITKKMDTLLSVLEQRGWIHRNDE